MFVSSTEIPIDRVNTGENCVLCQNSMRYLGFKARADTFLSFSVNVIEIFLFALIKFVDCLSSTMSDSAFIVFIQKYCN